MGKLVEKIFIKAILVTTSPMKIGSGFGDASDSDILLYASGQPFIPGTSMSGVLRHALEQDQGSQFVENWFGCTVPNEDKGQASNVVVYDAKLEDGEKANIVIRDGVSLNELKVAKPGAKFDYQVLDTGYKFSLRIEIDVPDVMYCKEDDKKIEVDSTAIIGAIIASLEQGDLAIGGKTTRGFGRFKPLIPVRVMRLVLNDPEDMEKLISFDWELLDRTNTDFDYNAEKVSKADQSSPYEHSVYETIIKEFDVKSFLMIRNYSARKSVDGNDQKSGYLESGYLDFEMLKSTSGDKPPIIPGTSWAGLFRHHMTKILRRAKYAQGDVDEIDAFIGTVFGTLAGSPQKSKIIFLESVVRADPGNPDNSPKQITRTRNSIDRFTGGAGEHKLFSYQASYGGMVRLEVKWPKQIEGVDGALLKSLVDAVLDDLASGHAAVGGMTSVGGGILRRRQSNEQ